jgi:error-prone DNA polymerase
MALAGFDHVEADGLRKVMSKKDRAKRLPDYLRRFVAGARSRGVTSEQIAAVWEMILSFDGYSFCKPHSASYARVSFQAAYLKTHFPAEFMAAVVSNQGGFYATAAYVSEIRRLGLRVLPPDVNASDIRWQGRDGMVRVGWLTLHHVSEETRGRIVAGRPFRDLADFLERARPDEEEARVLVHARAFDDLCPDESHAALLWQIALWRKRQAGRTSRDLFDRGIEIPRPALPPDDPYARLHAEMQALGFLCDVHPMVLYQQAVARQRVVAAKDIGRFVGRRVRCAGFLVTGKVVSTIQGEPMEFITFEDETGLLECTFFPDTYRRFCHMLDHHRPYLIAGKVEEDYGAFTVTVDGVSKLELDQARWDAEPCPQPLTTDMRSV